MVFLPNWAIGKSTPLSEEEVLTISGMIFRIVNKAENLCEEDSENSGNE